MIMPGCIAVILIFAVAVSAATTLAFASADTICGNRAVCSASETCVSNIRNAGHKYACSPFPNAVVCGDSRFSCPENSICNYANHSCDSINGRSALATNKNSHIVTGTIKHTPNDGLCDYLADYIPSFCQCDQDQTGTQAVINCSVSLFVALYSHNASVISNIYPGQFCRSGHHWLHCRFHTHFQVLS
jgi:hypothetical protein